MGTEEGNYLKLKEFPNLENEPFLITSPEIDIYNCLAWAMGDTENWWDAEEESMWLDNIPQDNLLSTLIQLLEIFGYELCAQANLEAGFEKIALFSKDKKECMHLARQLPDDNWTSKLGISYDVTHSLEAMKGGIYGETCKFLKRKLKH